MSLAELTVEDFAARRRETFVLSVAGATLDLVLAETETLGQGSHRRAFTLLFIGPAQPVLRQSIYSLDHPAMGALDIFLVPIGPRGGGMGYQAVFG